ncbi:MAG: response regulator [Gloeotrichia echinulata DVL01]|jgi:chemotaxis family two-component system response regulator PixG
MSYPPIIIGHENQLIYELKKCSHDQYNGRFNIKSSTGQQWNFYYQMGKIVWATGGNHPFRRWRRQMAENCPQIDVEKLLFPDKYVLTEYGDYLLLEILYKKQKIKLEQIHVILESTIAELLFDIKIHQHFATVSCYRHPQIISETPISLINADICTKYILEPWKSWSKAGLANFYPDLAPVLKEPEQLQQIVSLSAYKNFVKFMNGKYTLRDLAVKMKQNLLSVTRSLQPYISKGIIELVEVPDLPLAVTKVKTNLTTTRSNHPHPPLVACVDDSLQMCEILGRIMVGNGLRFIKVQDSVQALPTLIQNQPDLIFLDLIMPVTNGYEICGQLRRISAFTETPVIILTGSDGMFDRVRSKVFGATDFLTKPVVVDQVMAVLQKYLPSQC